MFGELVDHAIDPGEEDEWEADAGEHDVADEEEEVDDTHGAFSAVADFFGGEVVGYVAEQEEYRADHGDGDGALVEQDVLLFDSPDGDDECEGDYRVERGVDGGEEP